MFSHVDPTLSLEKLRTNIEGQFLTEKVPESKRKILLITCQLLQMLLEAWSLLE